MNTMKKKANRKIQVDFSDNVQFKLKSGDVRTITFRKDESATQPKLKKAQKTLTVSIAGGLDKNTDTAPQGVSRPTGTTGGGGGGRGRATGGGARGTGTGTATQQPINIQNTGGGGGARGRANPPGPGRSNPPPPSNQPKAKAMYPYQGQTQDELSFNQGDVIIIHKKDPGGWWEGELNGKRGWIPANYVQEI